MRNESRGLTEAITADEAPRLRRNGRGGGSEWIDVAELIGVSSR